MRKKCLDGCTSWRKKDSDCVNRIRSGVGTLDQFKKDYPDRLHGRRVRGNIVGKWRRPLRSRARSSTEHDRDVHHAALFRSRSF